jgi:aspartyl-tRNA(Asn)/glutamyl-tRNA(Gln) amidotransferase subunit A
VSGIRELSALELRDAIAAGKVSAVEAVEAYLGAIEQRNGQINAYNEVYRDEALAAARQADAARLAKEPLGALHGVPVSVKDNICTSWGRTTCSSKMLADFRSPYDATVVKRLRSAGAVVLGKNNMDEFAMGSSTENSSRGPARNPWDTARVPGGSSGGSAAAVAARMCAASLGSDTGGSIRQPAAFCGVVGLKPTYGRVSRSGLVAYGSSLDQIGPITRDSRDAALMLGAIAGHDSADSTSVNQPSPDYLASIDTPLEGLRLGLPGEFYSDALDAGIAASLRAAAATYERAGAKLVEVHLPHSRIDRDASGQLSSYAVACYYIVAMSEASSNLARYDGVHYGRRAAGDFEDIVEMYSRSRAEGFGAEVQRRVLLGTYTLSSGYYDAYYLKALKVRRLIKNDFDKALEQCDALLCPVSPTPPFAIGEKAGDPLTMYLADVYTISVNLAGLPGLAIPAGLSAEGLPIGMQLVGPVFREDMLLRAARMYELAGGAHMLCPPGAA